MKTLIVLLLLVLIRQESTAQISNFGTEFYGVFGLNQSSLPDSASFRLYIFALRTTSVHIEVPSLNFAKDTQVTAFSLLEVSLPNTDSASVELKTKGTVVQGAAIHITSEQPISVLALNYKQYTTDAFQIYPTDVLGTEYVVLSYPNSEIPSAQTSSLFTIAAAEDSTLVTVIPSVYTAWNQPSGTPHTIMMHEGDAIMFTPYVNPPAGDLTGSIVRATKPIAVFSGHERTEIPAGYTLPGSFNTSRDHLYEQLLPTHLLGDTLVIVPYTISQTGAQLARIIATKPNTVIESNGTPASLDSIGDHLQIDSVTDGLVYTSNNGIMAGQYMHTATHEQSGISDPSLALILPTNLYSRIHTFVSIPDVHFTSHYLSIVALGSSPSVTIDGVVLPQNIFTSIPLFPASYTTLMMEPGLHTISSDVPLNAHAIGIGTVISYAYNIGLGRDIPDAVESQSSEQPSQLAAAFDDRGLLTIRSRAEHSMRIRCTVYDVAGRELYAAPQTVPLFAGQTFTTEYRRETRPIYILIQEYDAHGKQIGAPVFLPVP